MQDPILKLKNELFYPMNVTSKILSLITLFILSSQAMADITADVGVTSEYVREGISQTGGRAALQAGITGTHHLGFYAGAWGSSIDHRSNDDIHSELDAFAGVNFPLLGKWSGDASLSRYTFHGDEEFKNTAYTEQALRLLWKNNFTAGYKYTDNYYGSGFAKSAYELAYTFQTSSFSIELFTANHRLQETDEDTNFGSENTDDYWQFRIGVARTYSHWDYRFNIDRTNLGKEFDGKTAIQFGIHRYFNLW